MFKATRKKSQWKTCGQRNREDQSGGGGAVMRGGEREDSEKPKVRESSHPRISQPREKAVEAFTWTELGPNRVKDGEGGEE